MFFLGGVDFAQIEGICLSISISQTNRPNSMIDRLRVHESLHEIQPDGRKKGSFWPFGLQ